VSILYVLLIVAVVYLLLRPSTPDPHVELAKSVIERNQDAKVSLDELKAAVRELKANEYRPDEKAGGTD
jgi:hypothetical protein